MTLADRLGSEVSEIIREPWDTRRGTVVPTTESIALSGGAVELTATFLYADLANSSKIAKELDRRVAAKILKSFLATSTRLIKFRGGTPISFDGDRVLGVFVGDSKNSSAAICAVNINYVVSQILKNKFQNSYDSVKNANFKINHGVGIDTGTILIVRAGVRGSNDLISIGRAPNLAAKLSDFREGEYTTYITASVYNLLNNDAKYNLKKDKNMWERRTWTFLGDQVTVYRSSWWRKP